MQIEGVYPILPTPFYDDGRFDAESQARLIRYQNEIGVHGVCILGFMGEAHKLSDEERRAVLQVTKDEIKKEMGFWVGIRALGTIGAIQQAIEAQNHGAEAVFVAPIDIQNDTALYRHYKDIHDAIDIPVAIHDFPEMFGGIVHSPDLIAKLANDGITPYIKLEDMPVGPKTTKVKELAQDNIGVFGGLGAIYMLEELERGASGIMSGFTYPEVLVKIFNLFKDGDLESATREFDNYAPLFRYEFQPKIGLAFRKHIYKKRGIFTSDYVRPPTLAVDNYTLEEFERTIARTGLVI